ncbi:hypothetical protein O181_009814 [Austropuccinia psidii MF-1]|uniref:Lysophospholipase n=1 Tax=Austropuccinia psidii MF-1 TaxID=1389203 RepID=A0A9Q3BPX7_9BASI|nr:hypothetical protein [Austropuccinia psidii MF-1]
MFFVKYPITLTGFYLANLIAPLLSINQPPLTYAPRRVNCPKSFTIRQAASSQIIGRQERFYLEKRRRTILPHAYAAYSKNLNKYCLLLKNSNATLPAYVQEILGSGNQELFPRLALAVAGGSYRGGYNIMFSTNNSFMAALPVLGTTLNTISTMSLGAFFGAAAMNTLDGRNATSIAAGTGGLLQAMDYITGLSGSAWLVTSWLESELAPLYDLVLGSPDRGVPNSKKSEGWFAQYNFFKPTELPAIANVSGVVDDVWIETKYWLKIVLQVLEKSFAGYPISVVDLWGRILSYHFLSGLEKTSGSFFERNFSQGLNQTFSGFANLPSFKNYSQPFPILTILPLAANSTEIFPLPLNSTQYEVSPFEFGSYDPFISAFIPTALLGTRMYLGKPKNIKECTMDFDNAGFMMGISSNLFPAYKKILQSYLNWAISFGKYIPKSMTGIIPNPFLGLGSSEYHEKDAQELNLVDGGFGYEIIPYAPLIVRARNVETIVAFDGTGDSHNFANGSSIIQTSKRAALYPSSYKFPQVPQNVSTYTSEGLVNHPTFFGCDEKVDVPLLIWIANSPPLDGSIPLTNTSTIQLTYPPNETSAMMNQALKTSYRGFPSQEMIQNNQFQDPLWPLCLSCAIVERSRQKLGKRREGLCEECFKRYCWRHSKAEKIEP